jgi:hypothetical protein
VCKKKKLIDATSDRKKRINMIWLRYRLKNDHPLRISLNFHLFFFVFLGYQGVGLFAVRPKRSCTHLRTINAPPANEEALSPRQPCEICEADDGNWVCLNCYIVLCGRDRKRHMMAHFVANNSHPLCLSFDDLSVWCYGCSSYVDYELPVREIKFRASFFVVDKIKIYIFRSKI